jgi:hypothetical protein
MLDQELHGWHNRMSIVQLHLNRSQSRSRLHPYLERQVPIPVPPAYYDRHTRVPFDPSCVIPMAEALTLDPPGTYQSEHPWYPERFGVQFTFGEPRSRCSYCKSHNHVALLCPSPHGRCACAPSCIIPTHHINFGGNCPYANLHLLDTGEDEEGYVGLEEGDGKS